MAATSNCSVQLAAQNLTNANGKSGTLSASDEWRDESESENKWSDSESIEILSAIII
ncbi:hypothetical protein [Microcoleus sp. OTE_8_concoct_300]|uniref:hypothetical protein n=1 Tax=Microcoleus sp. OTE_8_concoct_300 TaxID=2964710 RepID=UPI00403F1007